MTLRRFTLTLAVLAAFIPAGAARAATSLWTPINSGTTDTISAIVYQSPTRFWYATTNGRIAYWNGSAFVTGLSAPGEQFTDLAFQPGGGPVGYAVAGNGDVWQSGNAGASWTHLPSPTTLGANCTDSVAAPVNELNAVVWAAGTTAYLLGNNNTLEKSTNADTASPTFAEINKTGSGTCQAQSDSTSQNLTDATFLAANPLAGLVVTQDFGTIYGTSNGFSSGRQVTNQTVNDFTGNPRIAQDASNPNRLWVVDHKPGGAGCGILCLVLSTDGGTTSAPAKFANDQSPVAGLYGVSSQGGVEVTAGSGGEIFNSINGTDFFLNPAPGALRTANWRAEAAFDAAHAAVGGEGGALAITAQADHTQVVPPAPPSGSSAKTFTIGDATITLYRTVIVTGRSGRFVPVKVAGRAPHKLVVMILGANGKHKVLATGRFTVKRKVRSTLHVTLSTKLKPGKYLIEVRVLTPKGKPVGRQLKLAFALH